MYSLNPLDKETLITPWEVIFHAPTKHTLDSRQVSQSIIVAEERFIRFEIGSDFYEDLITTKNLVITSGNIAAQQVLMGSEPILQIGNMVNAAEYMTVEYQTLWKKYLWKIVAECVMVSAYPENYIQIGSQGAFHTVPPAGLQVTSGEVTPLLSSMKWLIDKKIQDRVGPLMQSLHIFLCKNKTTYPKYIKDCPGNCDDKTGEKPKNAGIALGIYDDNDKLKRIYTGDD